MVLSTVMGLSLGLLVVKLVGALFRDIELQSRTTIFRNSQIAGAVAMAFMHGAQDGQKFIGIFLLGIALSQGNATTDFMIPVWLMLLCSTVMALGTAIGGGKIIKTVGVNMVKLETYQGFSADFAGALSLLMASLFGLPVSTTTTHTKTIAIMGVGVGRHLSSVNWLTVKEMVYTWVLTFPCCGLVGYLMAKLFIQIFQEEPIMFKKKTEKLDYFDEFIKLAEWGVQSAAFLKQVLADYPIADLSQKLDEMHELEHNADLAIYRLMRYMYNDLLPLLDRQDVIALVTSLNHAIDMIEDVMIHIEIYQPQNITPEINRFLDLVEKSAEELLIAVRLLETYKKSQKEIHAVIDRINACEKEGDLLYIQSMRDLYQSGADAVNIVIRSKIHKSLEDCYDAFKDATKFVEEIALKYA